MSLNQEVPMGGYPPVVFVEVPKEHASKRSNKPIKSEPKSKPKSKTKIANIENILNLK